MNLSDVIDELRGLNEDVPDPFRLPTEAEVNAAEKRLNVKFPEDYRRYLLEASDVSFGDVEPAIVTDDCDYLNLVEIAEYAWDEIEIPQSLLPFCEYNGDYYCINRKGEIESWSSSGQSDDKWPDLGTWIKEVWIDGES
ncbi:MAG: SMI1/KNR4 family protein [Acidobacteria bacterium]|nr:SMI1/KNR4 family protein [Acidobacteriota bacterium]MBK8148746.1 SMI1/KNR4 family protein [Acidobacteriota bacterium]